MNVCILKMLHYDKIDVYEGINVKKTSESRVRYLSLLVFLK